MVGQLPHGPPCSYSPASDILLDLKITAIASLTTETAHQTLGAVYKFMVARIFLGGWGEGGWGGRGGGVHEEEVGRRRIGSVLDPS